MSNDDFTTIDDLTGEDQPQDQTQIQRLSPPSWRAIAISLTVLIAALLLGAVSPTLGRILLGVDTLAAIAALVGVFRYGPDCSPWHYR